MANDIILNKSETIRKCLKRINEDYADEPDVFLTNYTRQDAVTLNLERASQASIDIAAHLVRANKLGIPQTTRELFKLLEEKKYITQETSINMQKMVGFRNIAVRDYQTLNIDIIIHILKFHLKDFTKYIDEILKI